MKTIAPTNKYLPRLIKIYTFQLVVLVILLFSSLAASAQLIYKETFEDLGDGITSDGGSSGWTLSVPGSADQMETDLGQVYSNNTVFLTEDLDGQGVWFSDNFNVANFNQVTASALFAEFGNLASDEYIGMWYSLDGASYVNLFLQYDDFGSTLAERTFNINTTSATNLRIAIAMYSHEENHYYYFDDIMVRSTTGSSTIYSRGNNDWNDPAGWSLTSHGGSSCNCFPDESTHAIIGNSNTITINQGEDVGDLTVENTGILRYGGNYDLDVNNGGTVTIDVGGLIDWNNNPHADLDAAESNDDGTFTLTVNGTLDIGKIEVNGDNNTLNITDGSGTIIINNDFIMDAQNGTVNNSDQITIVDDFIMNDDGGGLNNIFNNLSGAQLTITDDINSNDQVFTLNNYGIITMAGDFTNIGASSAFHNRAGGVWNWSGANHDPDAALFASYDANNFNYTGTGNQDVVTPQDAYWNLTLSGSGIKESQGDINISGDLSITGTAQLDVSTNGNTITLGGNWSNDSGHANPFNEGVETVTFNGSTDQTITNAGGETFNNVTINKSAGKVTLASGTDVVVNGTLTLTSQHLEIGEEMLTIGNNGSISGGSASSHVITNGSGEFVQNNIGNGGKSNVVFPVGLTSTEYTPLIIDNAAGTADNFGVRMGQDVLEDGTSGSPVGGMVDKTWFISEAIAGGSAATLTFQWDATNEPGGFARNNLNVLHYNGSLWEQIVVSSAASGSDPYTVVASGVSDFSPFAIQDGNSILPVELISFNGEMVDQQVYLNWETASEINNDYFEIQRGNSDNQWKTLGKIDGNGTTNTATNYQFKDKNPAPGQNLYRLKQVDFNGDFEYSKIISINNSLNTNAEISIYPNPASDQVNLKLISAGDEDLTIGIYSAQGISLVSETTQIHAGANYIKLDVSHLEYGVYIMNITGFDEVITKKFIKR